MTVSNIKCSKDASHYTYYGVGGLWVCRDCNEVIPTESKAGLKFDDGKLDLLFMFEYWPDAIEAVCWVAEYGQRKYERGGFRAVPDRVFRYTKALLRHFKAAVIGQVYDDGDSGLPEDAMIAWNALSRLQFRIESGEVRIRRGNDIGPNGKPVLGTAREIYADVQAVPAPPPLTEQEQKVEALPEAQDQAAKAAVRVSWGLTPEPAGFYDREDHQAERPMVPLSPRIEENLKRIETEGRFAHACPDLDQELPECMVPRYEGYNPDASRSRRELATHPDNQGLGVTSHGEQLRKAS